MSVFRHPKTQSERKGDQALLHEDEDTTKKVKARVRSGKKGNSLPTERDDKLPASRTDRARGKQTQSFARKAKEKARGKLLS